MIADPFLGSAMPWIILFRICNALAVRTWHHPDEYWQSLEVAHVLVFGYGDLTWEWLPEYQIRGYLHPLIFASVYQFLKLTGLDSRLAMFIVPRIVQGLFAAAADIYTYKFARRLFGPSVAQYALFASLTNWMAFDAMVRTFSNSLETTLTAIVLAYWPFAIDLPNKKDEDKDKAGEMMAEVVTMRRKSIIAMALTFLMRPTSAICWIFLGIHHLWLLARSSLPKNSSFIGEVTKFVAEVTTIVFGACVVGVLIDRMCSGHWMFAPYNFFSFNVLSKVSSLYGEQTPLFYLLAYLSILALSLPAFLNGIRLSFGAPALMFFFVLGVYSMLLHKEVRFLFPLLPIAFLYTGKGLASFCSSSVLVKRIVLASLLLSNAFLFRFTLSRSESIEVVDWLAAQPDVKSVVMLLPCHSTPHYSALHLPQPITLGYVDCSPSRSPLFPSQLTMNFTEHFDFARDPLRFASEFFELPEKPALLSATCDDCSTLKVNNCTTNKCCAWFGAACGQLAANPLPKQWKSASGKLQGLPFTDLTYWGVNWRHKEKPLPLPSHLVVVKQTSPFIFPFLVHGGYKRAVSFEGFQGLEIWQRKQ